MDPAPVEATLAACEDALASGGPVDLRGLGFWRAVEAVKRRPESVEQYADRVAAIDRRAFEQAVSPVFPVRAGTGLLSLGTLVGLLLAAAAYAVSGPWNGLLVIAAAGLLLGTTHDLAHLLVGRALGMRFTHWFLDGPTRLQPGLKVDYASYLRTPPRARAWMHASGALATKIVPFALIGVAFGARAPAWAATALVAIGLLQIGTDLIFSIRVSDWKRFRREMRVAQHLEAQRP